jgi:transposase
VPILPPGPSPDSSPGHFASPPWHDLHPDRLALEARLPPDHLARAVEQAVAGLDLGPLRGAYAGTGSLAHCPELLLRAALFQTRRGQHSPAAWHRAAHESEPVRWLLRGCTPSRSAWYAFRDRLAPVLLQLNAQPLHQAVAQGLTPAVGGAADGTTVAANASRHRLLNEAKLQQRADQLTAAVAADGRGEPPPAVPPWMAKRPRGRLRQQRRLAKAQAELAQRQARNRGKKPSKRTPAAKVVISASDPEAALGLDKEKVFRPLYNVQVVDDLDSPLVLGYGVFAQPNDAGLLGALLRRVHALTGTALAELVADGGYAGGADLRAAAQAGAAVYAPLPQPSPGPGKYLPKSAFVWQPQERAYVCPQGHRLELAGAGREKRSGPERVVVQRYRCPAEHCRACSLAAACTPAPQAGRTVSRSEYEGEIEALRERMSSAAAQALYKLRGQTVELVNADWKGHRQLRRFSGRGVERAECQVGLIVLAHNLLTLRAEESKAKATTTARGPADPDPG